MHPDVHQALTRMALTNFEPWLPETVRNHTQEIIYGTKAEDHWWDPSRAMNWHFYRRKGSPILKRTRWLRMRPTSEYILGKRIEKMRSCDVDDPKRYKYLGRILHHIQDMSTPSHVRPVYHDPLLHDHFESFMVRELSMKTFSPDIPEDVMPSENNLMKIYSDAAEATLRFMETYTVSATVDGQAQELPLSVFWEDFSVREDKKHPGFGRFGKLHKLFKSKNRGNPVKASDGKTYVIELNELEQLNNTVCGKAIADTFRALMCST